MQVSFEKMENDVNCHAVNTLKFAECRAKEVLTLMEEALLKEPKLIQQKLPFHMRRRAASHNPKRLPKNVRLKIQDEVLTKHKKKSKNHKNLLEEYNSRQESHTWLPTHIWFAKRFHMTKIWGYQLPFKATGKRFRSCYRATIRNALLQDLSYFCCIELRGKEEDLLSQLSCLTNEFVGLNFAAESYIHGTKEGQCFMYYPNNFPLKCIGPVSFLWKPPMDSLERQLWIWSHPSITDELVKVFIEVFNLKENFVKSSKEYNFASKVNYMKCKLHFQKEPVYCNDDIAMSVLKDTLIRHRIIGPNATSIMTSILKPVDSTKDETLLIWNYLLNCESAYHIPMKSVIGLRVEDPRLCVAPKKEKTFHIESGFTDCILEKSFNPETAFSELWSIDIRNEVTASQIPEHVINYERGKYLKPDASDLKRCTTSVPIIVVHQPAVNGYASGWDLIAPQGWGMAFWIPFIHHSAQPAGLDDLYYTNTESGQPTFPLSFPDTKAGSMYEENARKEKLKKFNRYSRAKRPNFEILRVPSPFFMPWNILINEWKKEFLNKYKSSSVVSDISIKDESLFTLRNQKEINNIRNFCFLLQKTPYDNREKLVKEYKLIHNALSSEYLYLRALLMVRIKCITRGIPTNCSGIYMPTVSDLQHLKDNPKYFGPEEAKHYVNLELSGIPVKKKRKILKDVKQESKMLDRPSIETVISSVDRKIIGYVSEGGYSRLCSHGYGIGHCTLAGFLMLLELCMNFELGIVVLIKEQHTFQYRFSTLEVVNNLFGL